MSLVAVFGSVFPVFFRGLALAAIFGPFFLVSWRFGFSIRFLGAVFPVFFWCAGSNSHFLGRYSPSSWWFGFDISFWGIFPVFQGFFDVLALTVIFGPFFFAD